MRGLGEEWGEEGACGVERRGEKDGVEGLGGAAFVGGGGGEGPAGVGGVRGGIFVVRL
jgi:hypothetical protein